MLKFSSREKKMLYVLLLVAILSAFILAMRYFNGRISEKEAELTELQQYSAEIAAACAAVDETKAMIPELKQDSARICSMFEQRMTNAYIDNLITVTARDCGLTPYSLVIGDTANTQIMPFGFEESAEETGGLYYVCEVNFTASGREAALKEFIDAVNAEGSLHIREFSQTGSRTGTMNMMFIIRVYMIDPYAANAIA